MTVETGAIERYLAALRDAPARIAALTVAGDDSTLHLRTADEPWSVNDVLAHLRSAADVRARFIAAMSTGERTTIRYVSPRSELRMSGYVDLPFAENLAAFRAGRAALIDRLVALGPDGWSRGSLIRDRPETVASYVGYLTEHEAVHIDQIASLIRGLG
jgi:hypothetical protein